MLKSQGTEKSLSYQRQLNTLFAEAITDMFMTCVHVLPTWFKHLGVRIYNLLLLFVFLLQSIGFGLT